MKISCLETFYPETFPIEFFSNRKIVPTTILLTENRSATQMREKTPLHILKVSPLTVALIWLFTLRILIKNQS